MTASPLLKLGSKGGSVREAQTLLNRAGANLRVDGDFGPKTDAAVREFQRRMGLTADGLIGAKETWPSLRGARLAENPPPPPPPARPRADVPRFEAVTRAQAPSRFGAAGSPQATAGQCLLPFAMPLAWDQNQRINRFLCNAVLAEVMTWLYAETARHFGEAEFRRLRLDQWGGCFNHRRVRGGTLISIHSYGAAIDIDPARNGLHTPTAQSPLAGPEYAPWWAIVEATGGRALGKRIGRDWMHFSWVQE